jgi:hypothetical protein
MKKMSKHIKKDRFTHKYHSIKALTVANILQDKAIQNAQAERYNLPAATAKLTDTAIYKHKDIRIRVTMAFFTLLLGPIVIGAFFMEFIILSVDIRTILL